MSRAEGFSCGTNLLHAAQHTQQVPPGHLLQVRCRPVAGAQQLHEQVRVPGDVLQPLRRPGTEARARVSASFLLRGEIRLFNRNSVFSNVASQRKILSELFEFVQQNVESFCHGNNFSLYQYEDVKFARNEMQGEAGKQPLPPSLLENKKKRKEKHFQAYRRLHRISKRRLEAPVKRRVGNIAKLACAARKQMAYPPGVSGAHFLAPAICIIMQPSIFILFLYFQIFCCAQSTQRRVGSSLIHAVKVAADADVVRTYSLPDVVNVRWNKQSFPLTVGG